MHICSVSFSPLIKCTMGMERSTFLNIHNVVPLVVPRVPFFGGRLTMAHMKQNVAGSTLVCVMSFCYLSCMSCKTNCIGDKMSQGMPQDTPKGEGITTTMSTKLQTEPSHWYKTNALQSTQNIIAPAYVFFLALAILVFCNQALNTLLCLGTQPPLPLVGRLCK